ncbi:D-lactate dehydrogenase (cytochrome) [Cladophialophora yegresii CBS 114405]|uniref:D-lactate dehydrogenase (cytochrome) n=1 Tax=Cladophialophora yegresii CBS 114405 TaxID=1182544 RepID=W9X183_9EURO|nr:D-lactate dehydrogenase (cytochrome) [Cladophialophora yegresii CBS 114405]EXJ64249.1 D-lactate dehydrogenase (cytochrome) [Cladophialophora yegresii CBS 114405]
MEKSRLTLRLLKRCVKGNSRGTGSSTVPFSSRACTRTYLRDTPTKFYSTRASSAESHAKPNLPLWTTSRALLLAGALASIGYAVGVNDAGSHADELIPRKPKPPTYASKTELEKAITELRELLGEDAISTDDDDLKDHGYSEWSSINIDQLPVAVAYPKSTEEVAHIAKIASKYRVPMIPYSGGSSLEANFSAPFGGFSIDFAFMDQILAVHADDMDVVVQPAVQWMELNDKLQHTGLFFPVDPGPSAKIGGMVGTSCSGTNAFRYGTMKDWVINLTVVLPDGRIIKTRRRPRKTAAGYNLTGFFVGAEGTLGIVTEATLKLAVIPQETKVAVVTFPTIRDAAAAAMQIIRAGVPVAAMEIMDDVQMSVINRAGGTNRTWKEVPTIFFKFSGTMAGVKDNIDMTTQIAKKNHAGDFIYANDGREAHDLWKARKDALWSMLSLRREGDEVWSTDVAVPISRLPDMVEITKKEVDDLGLFASVLGHIGDGNFHTSVMYNRNDPKEREQVERVVHNMVDRALEMEGTCTGEHGIGLGKKQSLVSELGVETIGVMQTLKRSLDPHWLMNPGKIFDAVGPADTKSQPEATAASTLARPTDK